jgi:phenylacetate-CoA ligase
MPRYAEALSQHRPAWIEAFPSALYPLAALALENPLPEFTQNVRGVMLFSENVSAALLAKIREVFACPVIAHYGHSERVLMAGRCPTTTATSSGRSTGTSSCWTSATARHRAGRMGFVVGTSFDNEVMPFVRYRTGDLACSRKRPSELPGYTAATASSARCRSSSSAATIAGVDHDAGRGALRRAGRVRRDPVRAAQPGELVLKVAAEKPLGAAALARIAAAVERKTRAAATSRWSRCRTSRAPRAARRASSSSTSTCASTFGAGAVA